MHDLTDNSFWITVTQEYCDIPAIEGSICVLPVSIWILCEAASIHQEPLLALSPKILLPNWLKAKL